MEINDTYQVFNENPIHHDINEYYKIEKEKGIDKLLLIHDKEEVGFIQMNLKNIKLKNGNNY